MKVFVMKTQGVCGDSWCFIEGVYSTKAKANAMESYQEAMK